MPGRRDAARARLLEDLRRAAQAELAEVGAAALSLRAVARRLDLVPSALYRYVASRDDLLTLCIVDSYRRLGAHLEEADAGCGAERGSAARWVALGRATREWAMTHPAEWGLLFGAPVVGYRAPQDTIEPAGTLIRLLADTLQSAPGPLAPGLAVPLTPALESWLVGLDGAGFEGLADDVMALAVTGWILIVGGISLELNGQYGPDLTPAAAIHDHGLQVGASLVGLS